MAGGVLDAVKAAPPVAVSVAWLGGLTPNEWLVATTIAYTVVMLVHRLWHWNKPPAGK